MYKSSKIVFTTYDSTIADSFVDELLLDKDISQLFSIKIKLSLNTSALSIYDYFISKLSDEVFSKVFDGYNSVIWNNEYVISFAGKMSPKKSNNYNQLLYIYGRKEKVLTLENDFTTNFSKLAIQPHHTIKWLMKAEHGLESIKFPLKRDRQFHPEFYPYIKNIETLSERFIKSSSNVLILTGPPGLGKSSLINHIIEESRFKSQVVYDQDVMTMDNVYTDFLNSVIDDDGGIMIMEDADVILQKRKNSNQTMSKLLNVSDGIVDTSLAKFIFTANLENQNSLDHALIRKGRCFDIIEFRYLTFKEAKHAAQVANLPFEFNDDKDEFTLAEIFSNSVDLKIKEVRVGF